MPAFAEFALELPGGVTRKFHYRADSPGDIGVIQQIFHGHDYETTSFKQQHPRLVRYFTSQVAQGGRPLIIDAGANIGASPVFFAVQFAGSRVIAIEPQKDNAELLRLNCAGLDVLVREAAIGSKAGTGFLSDPGHSDWGFRVAESGEQAVPIVSIPDLLADSAAMECFPLVCKIDIEGGEAALFAQQTEWVDRFPLLIIELHDWLFPGESNSRNFLRTICQYNFDFVYRGENAFCFNNRLLGHASP